MPSDVTATDIFKFVSEVFDRTYGSEDLQYALTVMMASVDEEDPKHIVKQFSVVMGSYSSFCLTKIADKMNKERSQAVNALHESSVVSQGGT